MRGSASAEALRQDVHGMAQQEGAEQGKNSNSSGQRGWRRLNDVALGSRCKKWPSEGCEQVAHCDLS